MSKISIIVPFHNAEHCIDNCIKMVLNQTFQDYELILINDGSSDNSLAIAEKYANYDSRIIVINKLNTGVSDTRNYGIEVAKYEYVIFIDCDDSFDNTWIEVMYNTITKEKVDLVICGYTNVLISKNNIIYSDVVVENQRIKSKEQFFEKYISLRKEGLSDPLWNKIYKKSIIKDNDIKFPPLRRGEDVIFNMNYYSHITNCYILKETHYNYKIDYYNLPWKKYSQNYYLLVENEYQLVKEKLIEWNIFNKEAKEFQANHLISGFIDQIKNFLFYKKLSNKEMILNITTLMNNDCYKEAIKNCNFKGILNKIIIYNFQHKNFIFLINLIRFKTLLSNIKIWISYR